MFGQGTWCRMFSQGGGASWCLLSDIWWIWKRASTPSSLSVTFWPCDYSEVGSRITRRSCFSSFCEVSAPKSSKLKTDCEPPADYPRWNEYLFCLSRINMRNLRLLHSVRVGDAAELQATSQICVDCDTENVFCATSAGILGLSPQSQEVTAEFPFPEHVHSFLSRPAGKRTPVARLFLFSWEYKQQLWSPVFSCRFSWIWNQNLKSICPVMARCKWLARSTYQTKLLSV